jgi:hypothetical protein
MSSDQETRDRDAAVRTMLVERVVPPTEAPTMRLAPDRFRIGLVTAVVLVAIVAVSVIAVRFGTDRSAPAQGGLPTASLAVPLPAMTIPAGRVLGTYTNDGGEVQTHTIHPNGLALASVYSCVGDGQFLLAITHDSETGGDCGGGGGSSGNKGIAGSTTVKVTGEKGMRWKVVVVGIPETYITPKPVVSPADASGKPVPSCTAADLTARYEPVKRPKEVTGAAGGQIAFTNTTTTACALVGYPKVLFLADGQVLGHHTMERSDERMTIEKGMTAVIVQPKKVAYAEMDYYLPSYYDEPPLTPCVAESVHAVRVDIASTYANAAQQGVLDVQTGPITACLNGQYGVDGKYGQISASIFVGYSQE